MPQEIIVFISNLIANAHYFINTWRTNQGFYWLA